MPRIKLGGNMADPSEIKKLIRRYVKVEREMPLEEVSRRSQISKTTYGRRINAPEDFTLKELHDLGHALDIPQAEMEAAISKAVRYWA